MTPKDFLKSKNIPEPTYNGVRLVDNEMEAYKITDLLHEYAIEILKLANGVDKSASTCNLQNVVEQSEQLVSFLRQYQKACEIMHVNKIDAKNFVEQYKTN